MPRHGVSTLDLRLTFFLTGGLFFALPGGCWSVDDRRRLRDWQLALYLRGVRIRHRTGASCTRGTDVVPRRATGIRPPRIPDPPTGSASSAKTTSSPPFGTGAACPTHSLEQPPACRSDVRRLARFSGEEQRTLIKTLPRKGFRSLGPVAEAEGVAVAAVAEKAP